MLHSSNKSSVLKYIPQRPPFVLVDKLLHCDSEQTHTQLRIEEDNLFIEDGHFSETGMIENIAQTCAVRLGYLNQNQPVKIGVIGSISNFELYAFPKIGETIDTKIVIATELFNVILLDSEIVCGKQKMASCNMKVVLTNTAIEE